MMPVFNIFSFVTIDDSHLGSLVTAQYQLLGTLQVFFATDEHFQMAGAPMADLTHISRETGHNLHGRGIEPEINDEAGLLQTNTGEVLDTTIRHIEFQLPFDHVIA